MKRLFVFIMTILMVMTVMPTMAFAEGLPPLIATNPTSIGTFYNVYLYSDGDLLTMTSALDGTTITPPATNPTKEGYKFKGWYADENLETEFDFSQPITEDTDIFAKWEDNSAVIKKGVEKTTVKVQSEVTKSGIKLIWTKSKGYAVDYYEVLRSTKKDSEYKSIYKTKDGKTKSYTNTKSLTKNKTYYYKVRGVRLVDGEEIYTKLSNKTSRKAPKTSKVKVESGEIIVKPSSELVKPGKLEIKTKEGYNYYIYLDCKTDSKRDISVYVKGGETETINVANGDYELYYCYGKSWYGPKEKFGKNTVGAKADTVLKFEGNLLTSYTTYSITLYSVSKGNLSTKGVKMSNFPG